jgi:hypothetical protein
MSHDRKTLYKRRDQKCRQRNIFVYIKKKTKWNERMGAEGGGGGENSDEEKRYKEMKMILEGGEPIFKKSRIHLKILSAVRNTRSKFETKTSSPITGLDRTRGFQEVKVPRLRDNGTGWW